MCIPREFLRIIISETYYIVHGNIQALRIGGRGSWDTFTVLATILWKALNGKLNIITFSIVIVASLKGNIV